MTSATGHSVTSRSDPAAIPARSRPFSILLSALSTSLLFVGTGCHPDLSCRELGCETGKICDQSTGNCRRPDRPCRSGECGPDQACDPASGECRPDELRCPEHECANDQICETQTGFCRPSTDCDPSDCPSPGERCDERTGTCVPRPCETDSECPSGYYCGGARVCVAGCRRGASRCPPGTVCRVRDDASTGQCISRCTTDTDCPAGEHCRARRGQSVCVPEPPCKDEDDCREDEVCRNSSCERPPCQTNADCPGDLACDLAYGDCVGGECSEDVLAPNHSAEDAAEIGFETLTELRLCPGRDDWYALQLDSAESVDIRVEHPADRDLDAAVFGTEGRVIASNSQPPPESARADTAFRVRFTSTRRQTVRIRIFDGGLDRSRAERPSTGDAYELRVSHPPNIDCSDDGSEENDHPATASELPVQVGAPTRLEFQLCPGDIDWYRLPDVAAERGVWVKLLDAPNHLYVELRSHAGHVASGKPGDELRFRRTGQRGPWLIGVRSERARAASYALEYAVTPPYDCPAPGRHAQPGDATDLAPGRRASFALCPLDSDWEIDWLSLESPENVSALNLELEADGGFPDADVTLYERVTYDDGQKVGYDLLRSAAKLERTYRLSKLVDPSQTLLVRIGSDQPIDAFRRPPAYSVEYSYTD